MEIMYPSKAPKVRLDISASKMFESDNIDIIRIMLLPEEKIDVHKNPVDVIFYVLGGTGVLEIENETREVYADGCIYVKANTDRGWTNKSKENLYLLVIKHHHSS